MRFCTSFTATTFPHALVLADALERHHPGAGLHALAVGNAAERVDVPFIVLRLEEIGVDDPARMLQTYGPDDLAMLLRPALLAHVRDRCDGDDVCFLSADHDVLAPLEPAVGAGVGIGLVRRLAGELPDDPFAPSARDLATQGPFTPDFLVVGRRTRAHAFLEWYERRIWSLSSRMARGEPVHGLEAARRRSRQILTLAPSLFDIDVMDDPGLEVGAWNLHARPLTREDGHVIAGHRPLRTLHFEGFDPQKPYWLSAMFDRIRVVEDPILGELCEDYAQRLLDHGWQQPFSSRDVGRRLPNGLVLSERLLALHAEAAASGAIHGDIFGDDGCRAFMAWLRSPAPAGGASGVNRYLYRVYLDRSDLRQAFPDLDGIDGPGYAAWTRDLGRREMAIPDELLPPNSAPHVDSAPVPKPQGGVNVAGFFRGTLGLGEAARLYVGALEAVDVPVTTTTVEVDRPVGRADERLGKDYGKLAFADLSAAERSAFNLICVNADELGRFVADAGRDFFEDRRSIGVWAWETDVVPERWDKLYAHVDEIWVYSRYVAENLARAAPIPVICVPPPVVAPQSHGAVSGVDVPEGFRFMFMFDFFSTPARKNPSGVIEAFTRAFAPGEGPQLVIKTIHAEARAEAYDALRHAAAGRPDVHIVDCALSVDAKNALMAECDCYVSLHRSEGYGLTLAECMALGKPVIGTAFSGNLDFMSAANSYLVDYAMTVVGGDVEIYPSDGRWAEPDLDHAAALMREVYDDQDAARARGARAGRDIEATLAPAVVGRIVADRLLRLAGFSRTR